MGAFSKRIFGGSPENPSTSLANPATWLYTALGGTASASGVTVTNQSAMRSSAVFRCVSLISNTIASLPGLVYKYTSDGGREVARDHYLYRILKEQPNKRHSSYTFRQLLITPLLMSGDGIAPIFRERGQVSEIIPVDPLGVKIETTDTGRLEYDFTGIDPKFNNGLPVDQADVIHIPGIGFDGVRGMSVISAGREAIGLALVMEEYTARLHKNSTIARAAIEVPTSMTGKPETLSNLREGIRRMLTGDDAAIILDAGQKWHSLGISPIDAQTLDQRRYQVSDICRLFGVPPHMVGETDKSTSWGSGLEQQTTGFMQFTLRHWLVSIEQEINRKLFFKTPYFFEFALDGLLRGDTATRGDYYAKALRNSWMSPNDIRRLENLPRDPAGDDLLVDQTLTKLANLGANNDQNPVQTAIETD